MRFAFIVLLLTLFACGSEARSVDAAPPDAALPDADVPPYATNHDCTSDDECSSGLCWPNSWVQEWAFCTTDCWLTNGECGDGEVCAGTWIADIFPDYHCYTQCADPENGVYGGCIEGQHRITDNSGMGWCWTDLDTER